MEETILNPEKPAAADNTAVVKKWLGILSVSRFIRWMLILVTGYWLYANWHADIPLHQLAQRYAYPDSKFMEINGMAVHYRVSGKGEPLVLLHDANSSLHTWSGWTDTLASHYQVISVDLPGFGLTGPHPQGSYSGFMYASFFEQFVRQLKLPPFHLAGNGLGAQIAWFYASEHPDRLRKLILLDAPGFEEKHTPWIQLLAQTPVLNRVLWRITPKSFIELMLEDMYADDQKVTGSLIQRHFELLLRPGNRKAFTDRAQVIENRPPVDLIENIKTPTLILWGAEDTRISPEYAYEFHRRIRGALLKIYQNAGHWPQEENAGQSASDVHAFLEGRF